MYILYYYEIFRGQEYQKAVTLEVMGLCRIIFNHVRKLYKMFCRIY